MTTGGHHPPPQAVGALEPGLPEPRQAGREDLRFQSLRVRVGERRAGRGRQRVLPDTRLGGHFRPEQADMTAAVAVGELVPGFCESVGKSTVIFVETP